MPSQISVKTANNLVKSRTKKQEVRMKALNKTSLTVFIGIIAINMLVFTQIRPASIQQPMPDFTLPVYQGGEITLSEFKGKNVLLIFPRGLAGKDHWCHVCNYQYAELADLETSKNIRGENDLEIIFVLPYSKEMIQDWVDKFAAQMADIEKWKNPEDPEKLDERGRRRLDMVKKYFPKSYTFEKGKVPLPFPILIDAEREISKGLGVFTTEWGGSEIEQNVPTIYIIDKKGILRFKYISQNTFDRPGPGYLLEFISFMKLSEK
jgi:peroxiredoxin